MAIRELPDFLIDQIAAGEVIERPSNVVKELIENALDAGSNQIIIDVVDGGRTMISVIDNGSGMSREDLEKSIKRHATSKLPDNDLLNINFMGFRGEALPSIASVSDMTIDTYNGVDAHGWSLDCNTGQVKPSSWESGTRIRVLNLFTKTPARLKFLRTDKAEMMSVVEIVKRLAMARPDVGFVLNNRWRFTRGQSLNDRIIAVMGDEVDGRMLSIEDTSNSNGMLSLRGFISEPTMRRASSVDQYLFVNNRPVKDKVVVGALRAAYMDVMHAREFPLCALYLDLDPKSVDVNVSPSKTEVHFLEPSRVRGFLIRTLRGALSKTMVNFIPNQNNDFSNISSPTPVEFIMDFKNDFPGVHSPNPNHSDNFRIPEQSAQAEQVSQNTRPLGRVIGQYSNKYILAQGENCLIIIDQHAAHERIVYEQLRTHSIKVQPLLTPIVIKLKPEQVSAILEVKEEMKSNGLSVDMFGEDAIAIFEKPADWNLDWVIVLSDISDEVMEHGHSSQLQERLHLKLANYACHHSVRAGQKLDWVQMDALLRDIENTERAGQCNHGRPVYKIIKMSDLDTMFERI